MKTSLRTTLEKIKKSKYGLAEIASQHHLNGTFKALCDEKSFAELLFPGIPLEQRNILPKNLREVIIWSELILDENDIVKKASSVLTNIKLKGEKVGDIMDLTTEMVLLPQITQEALGKAVVDGIRNLNRRISNMSAHVSAVIASTEAKEAQFDQLEPDVTDDLLVAAEEHSSSSNSSGFGIQDDYMGEDWIGLILSDVKRYAKDEKLSYVDSAGAAVVSEGVRKIAGSSPELQVSWLENNQAMQEKYPALAELVQQLHALPFEINCTYNISFSSASMVLFGVMLFS